MELNVLHAWLTVNSVLLGINYLSFIIVHHVIPVKWDSIITFMWIVRMEIMLVQAVLLLVQLVLIHLFWPVWHVSQATSRTQQLKLYLNYNLGLCDLYHPRMYILCLCYHLWCLLLWCWYRKLWWTHMYRTPCTNYMWNWMFDLF